MSRLTQLLRVARPQATTMLASSQNSVATSSRVQLDLFRRRHYSDIQNRSGPIPPPPPNMTENHGKETESGSGGEQKRKSPHAQWYADTVPAMIPVALLGSAIYFVSPHYILYSLSVAMCLYYGRTRLNRVKPAIGIASDSTKAFDRKVPR